MKTIPYILIITLLLSCNKQPEYTLVDNRATDKTVALFANLMRCQQNGTILFGHQDATSYGRKWVGEYNRSDAKDVTGSHPAIIGLDFAGVTTTNQQRYKKVKQELIKSVVDTYNRGGITTFAWHAANPANNGSFYWDQNPVQAVPDIIPGGKLHNRYKEYLQAIADVSAGFKTSGGELIPVIFRPFHEYDGEWFWWGRGHGTKEEFITLWRFTVDYLKEDLGVHNFIYAFSPDCRFTTEEEFLDYYPGDEYVDMLGMDDYWDFRPDGANNPELAAMKLKIVSDVAQRKNKLAALTETGLEGITQPDWYTSVLLPIIQRIPVCYVLVWRNAHDMEHHYYVPDSGHPAVGDFIEFSQSEYILMENDLPGMYNFRP